jgi:glycosyltransferase involved in cell wall biosynthesis
MTARSGRVFWVNQFAVPPDQPGGTRHYDMAGELDRLGHDVRLLASDLSLHERRYSRRRSAWDLRVLSETIGDVGFEWLPAGSYERNDWRRVASMMVFAIAALGRLLVTRRHPGDVVIGSSPHLLGAAGAWAGARITRRRFILEVRDLWPESYTAVAGSGGAQERLLRTLADWLYRHSDHIVILAEGSRANVVDHGGPTERISFIPNGVDLDSFPTVDHEVGPRIRFVYAGAHGPANGLEVAVDAAAEVQRRGCSDIDVVLVGDGPAKAELLERARRTAAPVTFLAPVPKIEIPGLFGSMDAGLMLLADTELFSYGVSPNKLFDYLAADLPVVTNVPGFVTEVVEEAGAGFAVAPDDACALADGLIAMAEAIRTDASRYRSGREYVAAHFDRRALAARLDSILDTAA